MSGYFDHYNPNNPNNPNGPNGFTMPSNCTMCQKLTHTNKVSVIPGSLATSGLRQTYDGSVNGRPAVHINFEPFSQMTCNGRPVQTGGNPFFHVYIILDTDLNPPQYRVYIFSELGENYFDLFYRILHNNLSDNYEHRDNPNTNIDYIYHVMGGHQDTPHRMANLSFIVLRHQYAEDNNIYINNPTQLGSIQELDQKLNNILSLPECPQGRQGGSRKKKSRRRKSTRRRNKTPRCRRY